MEVFFSSDDAPVFVSPVLRIGHHHGASSSFFACIRTSFSPVSLRQIWTSSSSLPHRVSSSLYLYASSMSHAHTFTLSRARLGRLESVAEAAVGAGVAASAGVNARLRSGPLSPQAVRGRGRREGGERACRGRRGPIRGGARRASQDAACVSVAVGVLRLRRLRSFGIWVGGGCRGVVRWGLLALRRRRCGLRRGVLRGGRLRGGRLWCRLLRGG